MLDTPGPATCLEWSCAPALPRRIPSLDGLRAASILIVLAAHLVHGHHGRIFDRIDHLGNFGVKVFFEISGFLITTLLLREAAGSGRIDLPDFYRRRVLRIFPAYWTYLAVLFLLLMIGSIELRPGDLLASATYTANYHHDRSWYVNHLWSLSVEEQFYLTWPMLIVLLGARRAMFVAAAVILAAPCIRGYMWYDLHVGASRMTRQFEAAADALAAGCLLAGCYNWLGTKRAYVAFLRGPWFWPALLLGCALSVAGGLGWFYFIGQSLAHLTILLCIDRCVRFPSTAIGRLLNSRLAVFLGVLSYSLYLWQMLFVNPFSSWWFCRFPQNVACSFLAALASYYLVERPFLRLKSHHRRKASAPIEQPADCVGEAPCDAVDDLSPALDA